MLERTSRGQPLELLPCKVIAKIIWSEDSEIYPGVLNTSKDRNHIVSPSTCSSVYPPSWQSEAMLLSYLNFLCSSLLYLLCSVHSLCTFKMSPFTVHSPIRFLQTTPRFLVHLLFLCWAENLPQPFHIHPVFNPPAIPVGLCYTHSNVSIFLFLHWVATTPHILSHNCQIEEKDHFSGLSAHKPFLKSSGCDWPPIFQGHNSAGRC